MKNEEVRISKLIEDVSKYYLIEILTFQILNFKD
jgi:hypothetical protein